MTTANAAKPGASTTAKHSGEDYANHHIDQRAAAYRPADDLNRTCSGCEHFVGGSFVGRCELVAGDIRPDYLCDLYERSTRVRPTMTMAKAKANVVVKAADDERQLAFGWASVSEDSKGVEVIDHHGEAIDSVDLEDAAYAFAMRYGEMNDEHEGPVVALLVESFMSTPEKREAMGLTKGDDSPEVGWWTGWFIPDAELYKAVKSGKRRMLSIEGWAETEEIADGSPTS